MDEEKSLSITICISCRYCQMQAPEKIWYNAICSAIEREKAIDPVFGDEGYRATNSLGQCYLTDQKHPWCREVNFGACEHYDNKQLPSFKEKVLRLVKR